ncbi:MAG: addiction module antidote protein [Caulobacteraceae bacterium]
MGVEGFISRWSGREGGAERANYALLLTELTAALDLPSPEPADSASGYRFEYPVRGNAGQPLRIDLYKKGCFILEAKQSRLLAEAVAPLTADALAARFKGRGAGCRWETSVMRRQSGRDQRAAHRSRARVSGVFCATWLGDRDFAVRRRQGFAAKGHPRRQANGEGVGLMAITTKAWDVTEHLDSEQAIAGYLDAVFEDGDPGLIKSAIGDVARARGMSEIAAKAGISRVGLCKALSETGNPSFATIVSVMKALGVRLSVAA